MTGPEHYQAAEDLLAMATEQQMAAISGDPTAGDPVEIVHLHARAQVHATLAMAAAAATAWFDSGLDETWRQVAGNPEPAP